MIVVPGYSVAAVLRESRRSRILRAVREADGAPVVLKALRREHPSLRDVARLRHEHAILRRFSDEGVIGTGGMIELGSRALLVLEDFGGAALSERIPRGGMALADFMAIAPRLVRAIAAVHAAGVLHKDIKPDNVIVGSEPLRVALADFSIASVLAEEPGEAPASAVLEGSLAYLAPEQTGRMNRPVDYRSDYYALGATFYEMLTGAPPFDSADPLELVHAHVARVPPAPRERRADVPEGLSALVMRLLAKTAEARYQSAAGLLADLERVAALSMAPGRRCSRRGSGTSASSSCCRRRWSGARPTLRRCWRRSSGRRRGTTNGCCWPGRRGSGSRRWCGRSTGRWCGTADISAAASSTSSRAARRTRR
jgi:serine/threonine protein kinase